MLRPLASLNPFLIAGACLLAGAAHAAGQSAAPPQPVPASESTEDSGDEEMEDGARVEVSASSDYGELPYRYYVAAQRRLRSHLPQEALVDMWFRPTYPGMREVQRDAFLPPGWTIAIHSRSVDLEVPMQRGAFFRLPEIQEAWDEEASIMFRKVNRPWLGIWWTLRVPAGQRIAYADIGRARAQIAAVQRRISLHERQWHFWKTKRNRYDGIKACFHGGSGQIRVAGTVMQDAVRGNCKVLFTDPARVASADFVEFEGPLSFVSFVDQSYYPQKK